MLREMSVTNFQSHRNSVLEFHTGLNVISGSSGSGKSTIVRALNLALKGKPSGGNYKSWSAKESDPVEVALEFDNGFFTRKRVGSKNSYETESGSFEALRSDVPEAIQNIASMTDYNLQSQFDGYFLLQDSPGEVAKKLNDLAGLGIIDTVTKKLNSGVTSAKQEITRTESSITSLKTQIEELQFLDAVDVAMKSLCSDIDSHEKTSQKRNLLVSAIQSLNDIDSKLEKANQFLEIEEPYLKIKAKQDELVVLKKKHDTLQELVANLGGIDEQLAGDKEWLAIEKPYSELLTKVAHLAVLKENHKKLKSLVDTLDKLNEESEMQEHLLDKKISKYTDLLVKSGKCPICQSQITAGAAKKLVEGMRG